jgi:hypothetical protein
VARVKHFRGDGGAPTTGMTGLKNVQRPSHIALAESYETIHRVGLDANVLFLNHLVN